MNHDTFKFQNQTISLCLKAPKNSYHFVIFLPGGSRSNCKERFQEWQEALFAKGIGSLSFDFPGTGRSSGVLENSSLADRRQCVQEIAAWLIQQQPQASISLYGLSMGGYVALGVSHTRPELFKNLILHVPAAYSPQADNLLFGEDFTQELRRPDSWKKSFAFDWLRQYQGDAFFIHHENDEIIPSELTERYLLAGRSKPNFTYLEIEGMPHAIWGDGEAGRKARTKAYLAIEKFLTS